MELPVFDVKKRSSSKDEGAARPRWQRLALLTACIAATAFAAVEYRRQHPPPPPPPLLPGQILTCGLRHGSFWPWYYAVAENTHCTVLKASSGLQFGVSRGRREVLLDLRGRLYQSDVVSEFGPKTW